MQANTRRKISPAEILFILLISGQFALYGFPPKFCSSC